MILHVNKHYYLTVVLCHGLHVLLLNFTMNAILRPPCALCISNIHFREIECTKDRKSIPHRRLVEISFLCTTVPSHLRTPVHISNIQIRENKMYKYIFYNTPYLRVEISCLCTTVPYHLRTHL